MILFTLQQFTFSIFQWTLLSHITVFNMLLLFLCHCKWFTFSLFFYLPASTHHWMDLIIDVFIWLIQLLLQSSTSSDWYLPILLQLTLYRINMTLESCPYRLISILLQFLVQVIKLLSCLSRYPRSYPALKTFLDLTLLRRRLTGQLLFDLLIQFIQFKPLSKLSQ